MSHSPKPTAKLRILVVDDELTLRLGFAYALTDFSCAAESAANGHDAIARLMEDFFDVVILDLRMPELDGIGVIETLRSLGNPVPIILCSAALDAASALRAIRLGVVDFLLKPVRPLDLRQAVRFVTEPPTSQLAQALALARGGALSAAVERLTPPTTDPASHGWHQILHAIQSPDPTCDDFQIEALVRIHLPSLAINPGKPT
jgi:CheY-like chemotaxis protein